MSASSSNLTEIRVTKNPSSAIWQVPVANPEYEVALTGWVLREPMVDSVVPTEVARILSESLTRLAAVTFLYSLPQTVVATANEWREVEGGWATVLSAPGGILARKRNLPLLCTTNPKIARLMFSAEPFDWSQRGQLAFLTQKTEQPPALDYRLVEQCFHRQSLGAILSSQVPLLLGLLYPGVDGDFAGVASAESRFLPVFLEDLRCSCEAADVSFAITSEDEFKRTAWTAPLR